MKFANTAQRMIVFFVLVVLCCVYIILYFYNILILACNPTKPAVPRNWFRTPKVMRHLNLLHIYPMILAERPESRVTYDSLNELGLARITGI